MGFLIRCRPDCRGRWLALDHAVDDADRCRREAGWRHVAPWTSSEWETLVAEEPSKVGTEFLRQIREGAVSQAAAVSLSAGAGAGARSVGTDADAVLHAATTLGMEVTLNFEGTNLLVQPRERITQEFRELLSKHRTEVIQMLKDERNRPRPTEKPPWNQIDAQEASQEARKAFGEFWDILQKEDLPPKFLQAAVGILSDSVSLLGESILKGDSDLLVRKARYIVWLCFVIRDRIDAMRDQGGKWSWNDWCTQIACELKNDKPFSIPTNERTVTDRKAIQKADTIK